ncbi:MAG: translation initiation factor IF-2 subunit beta [Thermoplasmata archaeon]
MPTYEELLERVKKELPETSISRERFQVPEAEVLLEGQITVLRNFADIADAINRKPQDVFAFLLKELGTSGSLEERRALFKGRLSADKINKRILSYVDEYVLCAECNRPDTHIVKEGRIAILQCDACGARRSLRVIKKAAKTEEPVLQTGKTYEVMIQDIGKKGDGVARRENYVIYVPGTTKGIVVKIEVEKIVGNVAFAKLVPE